MVSQGFQIVFAISNLILTAAALGFYLLVFGRGSSAVQKWGFIAHWSLRTGLALIISGAFLTLLMMPTPNVIQLMRSSGLALLFVWAFMFHYKYFRR
jgi:hypothetical protein